MSILFASLRLIGALALLPFALDWRSPFLLTVRQGALVVLLAGPLALALTEIWIWRSRPRWRSAGALHAAIVAIAVSAAACTLFLEARFQWMRQQVLNAEPRELERLGRHLIVGNRDAAELRALVERRAVAGVFVAAHNVRHRTVDEVRQGIQVLQTMRAGQNLPALWIATDQEGGPVSRLSPPLARSGSLSDIVERYSDWATRSLEVGQFAAHQARELAALGVNVNFAPVVDLNHRTFNPDDRYTRIYAQAIAADPQVVTEVASRYCSVLWQGGVRCTLMHFPGLGRVFEDTHHEEADLTTSISELAATDWVPFRALMQDGIAFTMLGHARLTAVDPDRPASFSRPVVAGMIRGTWQHDGILVTDDLCMSAVYRSRDGIGQAAIEALNAGVDLILVSFDPGQYYPIMYALLQADRQGTLDRESLQRSENRLARATNPFRTAAALLSR